MAWIRPPSSLIGSARISECKPSLTLIPRRKHCYKHFMALLASLCGNVAQQALIRLTKTPLQVRVEVQTKQSSSRIPYHTVSTNHFLLSFFLLPRKSKTEVSVRPSAGCTFVLRTFVEPITIRELICLLFRILQVLRTNKERWMAFQVSPLMLILWSKSVLGTFHPSTSAKFRNLVAYCRVY